MSHSIRQEIKDLIFATVAPIHHTKTIQKYELVIADHFDSNDVKVFPFARTAFFAILKSLELPPGSEIVMPSITIKPFLDVALYFNLSPVFVDLDTKTGVWETRGLEKSLSKNTRVALLTYLFGVVPKVDEILQILKKHNVIVVEDFSHSFGASFKNQKLGSFGDFGICSTSSTKSFDTYGGAVLITSNKKYLESILKTHENLGRAKRHNLLKKIFRNLALNIATNTFIFGILTFHIIKLKNRKEHFEVGKYTGDRNLDPITKLPKIWFDHFSSFQAQIGMREIRQLNTKDTRRRTIARKYTSELNLQGPRGTEEDFSTYWQYISIERMATKFRNYLNENQIDCATTSLTNLTKLPSYNLNLELQYTDEIYFKGVYLPCYHQLTNSQQNRIISTIKLYYESE